jgi:DNA polymerase-3 subunit delta
MTPDEAMAEATNGKLRPLYLVTGEETYLISSVLSALRKAALAGAIPGLNDDQLIAGERTVDDVLAAARTLPMMAKRRLVTVQRVERWEPRSGEDGPAATSAKAPKDPLERLVDYAKNPSESTVLILVGATLDKRRKLYVTGRNEGWLVVCEPLARPDLPGFVERQAARLGAKLAPGSSDLIAELSGPGLAPTVDALERLSLYAGGELITEDMVSECIVRLRTSTVWELLNAIGRRDVGAAFTALADVFDPSESIRLIGLLAWSTRQLLRFESALRAGASPNEAAQQAGAPPFKARELQSQLKVVPREQLESWLTILARLDSDLKGGSKLPQQAILERGILELCARRGDAA